MDAGSFSDEAEGMTAGANDLAIHPSGRTLYCSHTDDSIAVMRIEEEGRLRLLQRIGCGGVRPRAICLSLDGRLLYAGNNRSEDITVFDIQKEGILTLRPGKAAEGVLPSAMKMMMLA